MDVKIERIQPGQLWTDRDLQMRAALDSDLIDDLIRALHADPSDLPPVDVFFYDGHYWIADGAHRVQAYMRALRKDIPCRVHEGGKRDALLFACGVNAEHGLRRTPADKRRAVETLLKDPEWSQWSDREIARRCNVSDRFVNPIRAELSANGSQMEERKVQRGGTVYKQKTGSRKRRLSPTKKLAKEARAIFEENRVHTRKPGKAQPDQSAPQDTAPPPRSPKDEEEGNLRHYLSDYLGTLEGIRKVLEPINADAWTIFNRKNQPLLQRLATAAERLVDVLHNAEAPAAETSEPSPPSQEDVAQLLDELDEIGRMHECRMSPGAVRVIATKLRRRLADIRGLLKEIRQECRKSLAAIALTLIVERVTRADRALSGKGPKKGQRTAI